MPRAPICDLAAAGESPLSVEDRAAAIVGLAGGTVASQLLAFYKGIYDVKVERAEIDPLIIRLARSYFGLHLVPTGDPMRTVCAQQAGRPVVRRAPNPPRSRPRRWSHRETPALSGDHGHRHHHFLERRGFASHVHSSRACVIVTG